MAQKATPRRNSYRCSMEVNQNGKYCVRIRASFSRHSWVLPVYYLASSFDRAIKKLDQALQFLQRYEDKLWFWVQDRTDDPNLANDFLKDAGLRLDRRGEFPRKAASLDVPHDRPVPAFLLAPARRMLADSIANARVQAAASD